MNKNILFLIDDQQNQGKYSQEDRENNAKDAANNKDAVEYAAAASRQVAGMSSGKFFADANHLINVFFRITGEDKQKYIDEIKRNNLK